MDEFGWLEVNDSRRAPTRAQIAPGALSAQAESKPINAVVLNIAQGPHDEKVWRALMSPSRFI